MNSGASRPRAILLDFYGAAVMSAEQKKDTIKKLKMKKRVEDMGDGRYIVYYEWH
jgi:hypothetical protein